MATQTKAQKKAKREAELAEMSAAELRKMLHKQHAATSFSKTRMIEMLVAHEIDGEELPAARPRVAA